MSLQMQATAGLAGRKLKRRATTELEAKLPFLREMEQQKLQQQMFDKQLAQDAAQAKESHKLKKKQLALEATTAEREMGVSALKFGANLAMDGGDTLGDIGTKVGDAFGKVKGWLGGNAPVSNATNLSNASWSPNTRSGLATNIGKGATWGRNTEVSASGPTASTGGGFFGSMKPGLILGSGLAGFGASRLVKGKGKRMLLGAGVSGLMSLFGGGGGMTSLGSTLLGGLGGLLG